MDIFKTKQYKLELEKYQLQISELENKNNELKSLLTPEHKTIQILNEEIIYKQSTITTLNQETSSLYSKVAELENVINEKTKEIVVLDEELLYQSVGIYSPTYEFANSSLYKDKLKEIRENQKHLIKMNQAVISGAGWAINGDAKAGAKMNKNNIKQILRTFNLECENAVSTVNVTNYENIHKRIQKSYTQLNKLNEMNQVSIDSKYYDIKIKELYLALDYSRKKEEEKEQQRLIKQQIAEEKKVEKEIKDKQDKTRKEQTHYKNKLKELEKQLKMEKDKNQLLILEEKKNEIINQIDDLDKAIKEVDYRQANQKAGYVYIISNLGAFGEDVYKIGMSRRLDPYERINELGGASVPFGFDVHAMIFSDNAPGLENTLHKTFSDKKVNLVNGRKEFFSLSLAEIEEAIKNNHDKTVEFNYSCTAKEYRESLTISGKSQLPFNVSKSNVSKQVVQKKKDVILGANLDYTKFDLTKAIVGTSTLNDVNYVSLFEFLIDELNQLPNDQLNNVISLNNHGNFVYRTKEEVTMKFCVKVGDYYLSVDDNPNYLMDLLSKMFSIFKVDTSMVKLTLKECV